MKAIFFWVLVVAMGSDLWATFAAVAEPNDVHKIAAAQQTGKPRKQLQTFGKQSKKPYFAAPRTKKPGLNGTEVKKSSSSINGTPIRRKH